MPAPTSLGYGCLWRRPGNRGWTHVRAGTRDVDAPPGVRARPCAARGVPQGCVPFTFAREGRYPGQGNIMRSTARLVGVRGGVLSVGHETSWGGYVGGKLVVA
eukprot:COSAG02_NODE_863_length_16409_cov_16.571613_3_plen_103_part_00